MPDLMTRLTSNPVAKAVGIPQSAPLRRGRQQPTGPVVLGSVGDGDLGVRVLGALDIEPATALVDTPASRTTETDDKGRERALPPRYADRVGALVLDATAARVLTDLEMVRAVLRPAIKALAPSGRVLVLGLDPARLDQPEACATQQALEGIVRSVGKELRAGATANLVRVSEVGDGTPAALASTVAFFLDGRSAYVSGQPVLVGPAADPVAGALTQRPFDGQVVVVTGAARGIGSSIAEVFARDGATVVGVDVPGAGDALAAVTNRLGQQATALQLDITAPEAGQRIAEHVSSRYGASTRIHAVVHNAGITRDKLMVNIDEQRWGSVLEVNLAAQLRMNETLLDPDLPGGLADGGRLVGVASTSGIAGNRGQANYAASKSGVIGLVRALAGSDRLRGRGITINAVAPGFIETEMTAAMPALTREVARRINSLNQGGRPVDVAETVAWLAQPASAGVTGQVVRVCGQAQIGA